MTVNIDVNDLERAVEFYTSALDFRVGRRFGGDGVELLGGNANVCLLANPAGTEPFLGAEQRRDYARHWTPVHIDFAVDDLDAALAQALAAGASHEGGTSTFPWGRIALLADPFGNGFCLIQFSELGYDAVAER